MPPSTCLLIVQPGRACAATTGTAACAQLRLACALLQSNTSQCKLVCKTLQAMDDKKDLIDEAFLSSCFAYIKKASEDNIAEIVHALQKVLQIFAADSLAAKDLGTSEDAMLTDILTADEAEWEPTIRSMAESGALTHAQHAGHIAACSCTIAYRVAEKQGLGACLEPLQATHAHSQSYSMSATVHRVAGDMSETLFISALQKRMENTILGLKSGSYTQRVQAEYLKEVEERGKKVFASMAGAPAQ